MTRVALQTNCWRRDWQEVLGTDRLRLLVERNDFAFSERVLLINALDDYAPAIALAKGAVEQGWISSWVIVEERADAALAAVGLTRADLADSYGYSIAELVGLHISAADYVLYFMSDCMPDETHSWIPQAITLLDDEPAIKVANLLWDGNLEEARRESVRDSGDFLIGRGFSDQCYLVRRTDLYAPIYGYNHPASARYPAYGRHGFERRVDSWMQTKGYLRATYKRASYSHTHRPLSIGERIQRRLRAVAAKAGL